MDSATRKRLGIKPMSEKVFQGQVEQLAIQCCGWLLYHTRYSLRSPAGFPDLVLVRRGRLIFAELKRDGKDPTPAQQGWAEQLRACQGVEVYLWRPADWDDIVKILA